VTQFRVEPGCRLIDLFANCVLVVIMNVYRYCDLSPFGKGGGGHVKTFLVSKWLPAALCGVRSVFFDVVIRCNVMSRCIICCSLPYILRARNEFLNSFSAATYRISIGLVMSVAGDRVTLQWCDVLAFCCRVWRIGVSCSLPCIFTSGTEGNTSTINNKCTYITFT